MASYICLGGIKMSSDVMWILDILNLQICSYKNEISTNNQLKRETFEKYSYSSWAISETLKAIADYEGCVCVGHIREILKMQLSDYTEWHSKDPTKYYKYAYAADIITYMLTLTEGWVIDEYNVNILGGHLHD